VHVGRKVGIADAGKHFDLVNAGCKTAGLVDEHFAPFEETPARSGFLAQLRQRVDFIADAEAVLLEGEDFAIDGDGEAIELRETRTW